MNKTGVIVAVIGLLFLLGGLASPATQTQTSTTCIDSQYDPADGCVKTTYQTPNYARGGLIMFGLALGIGGLVFAMKDTSASSPPTSIRKTKTHRTNSDTIEHTTPLHERVQNRRESRGSSDTDTSDNS